MSLFLGSFIKCENRHHLLCYQRSYLKSKPRLSLEAADFCTACLCLFWGSLFHRDWTSSLFFLVHSCCPSGNETGMPSHCASCSCRAKSLQSCLTLCNPMNYSPRGSSVHGILQARILERVAMPSSRGSSRPRDQTLLCLACTGRQILYP